MKKLFFSFSAVAVICLTLLCICLFSETITASADDDITILFTNDLHSHLISSANEHGEGGYAKLMSLIKNQRGYDPDAILVDGGDFSMGSLFQTIYTTSAIDLRVMGAMGYDVTTFGENEYAYSTSGLQSMLNAALESGESLPSIVCANYKPAKKAQAMWETWNRYGIEDYIILERGGVYFAIFGILGSDAAEELSNSDMTFEDPIKAAKKTVAAAVKDCKENFGAEPIVICLSHSGTTNGKGEDYKLAKSVDGIHVIISGHAHVKLDQPIIVNQTVIASADDLGGYLGVIKLKSNGQLKSYELIPVYEWIPEDAEIISLIEKYKQEVNQNYLSDYGFTFDEILLHNPYTFDTVGQVYSTQHESTLGNLIADAYRYSAELITKERIDVALIVAGRIKATLPAGEVTVFDIFNIVPFNIDQEDALISVYMTGKDLKNLMELDASAHSFVQWAQLFMSGTEYSIYTNHRIFNNTDSAKLRNPDGTLSEIEDKKLYRVVASLYVGQMVETVQKKSLGILSITPRDADGNPIELKDLVNYVIKDENGKPLNEWSAIATYLQTMGDEMDLRYAQPDGRKKILESQTFLENIFSPTNETDGDIFTRNVLIRLWIIISLAIALSVATIKLISKRKRQHKP